MQYVPDTLLVSLVLAAERPQLWSFIDFDAYPVKPGKTYHVMNVTTGNFLRESESDNQVRVILSS